MDVALCNGAKDPPSCRTDYAGKCADPIVGENVRDTCRVECDTCVPIVVPGEFQESSSPPDSGNSIGLAVGAGVGGLVVVAAIVWCCKRRRTGNGEDHFANFVFYKDRTAKAAATTAYANPGFLGDTSAFDGPDEIICDPWSAPTDNAGGEPQQPQPGQPGSWYAKEEAAQSLLAEPWYFGKISRSETEEILSNKPPNTFIVRVSDKYKGYAITVFHEKDKVMGFSHIKVVAHTNPGGQPIWLVSDKQFTSIAKVVRFYQTHTYKGAFQLGAPARSKTSGTEDGNNVYDTGVPGVKSKQTQKQKQKQQETNNVYDTGVPAAAKPKPQRSRSMSGGGRPATKPFKSAPAVPVRGRSLHGYASSTTTSKSKQTQKKQQKQQETNNVYDTGVPTTATPQRSRSMSGGGRPATKPFKSAPAVPARGRSLHGRASSTTTNTYATLGATGRSHRAMTLDSGTSLYAAARHGSGNSTGSGSQLYNTLSRKGSTATPDQAEQNNVYDTGVPHTSGGGAAASSNNVYDAGTPTAIKGGRSSRKGAAAEVLDDDSSEDSEIDC